MPRIPTYDPQVSPRGGGLGPGPSEIQATTARGLTALARGADQLDATIQQGREEDAAAWGAQTLAQAQSDWTQTLLTRKQDAPAGAPNFTPQLLTDFDEYAKKTTAQAPTKRIRQFLEQRFTSLRGSLATDAIAFEAASSNANNTDIAKKSIDSARNELQIRPDAFGERLAERAALIDSMRLPASSKQTLTDYATRTLSHDAVLGLIQRDPRETLKLLNTDPGKVGVASVAVLDADDRIQLRNAAEAEVRQRDAEAKANLTQARQTMDDQLRDIAAAAQAGIPVTNLPNEQVLKTLYGDHEGTQRYQAAVRAGQVSNTVANLNSMSNAELVGVVTGPPSKDEVMRNVKRTTLSPDQETAYRAWLSKIGMTREAGYNLDEGFTGRDYDLRGFFKKYGPADVNVRGGQHFTDEFKLPNHETFSDQSIYATGPARALAGHWDGDKYVPATQAFGPPTQVEGASEQAQLHAFMSQSVQRILTERAKDPAGYLVQYSPSTREAWTQLNAAQTPEAQAASTENYLRTVRAERERLQIPGDDILPNSYAQGIADQINTAQNGEQLATTLEQEGDRWGAAWPQVYGQLAPKLTDTALVVGSGIPRSAATALTSMAQLKDTELKALLPPSTKYQDVQDEVAKRLEDFQRSFPPEGARTFNAFREAATRLTVRYMSQGASRSDAAVKAYQDLVGQQYQMIEYRGSTIRAPNSVDGRAIEDGARGALERFAPTSSAIAVPPGSPLTAEEYATQYGSYVREHGYWVTQPDGKGVRLYVDGGPVVDQGAPVSMTWEQLVGMHGQLETKRTDEMRARALRRQEAR